MLKDLKYKVRLKIISEYLNVIYKEDISSESLRETISHILSEIIYRERAVVSDTDKHKIISALVDDFIGYGPIQDLFKDPQITEIMINGPQKIYVEKNGKKELTNITFDDEQQLMALIYRILSPTRRRIDESYPYTDLALKDGSRVNIIIPPLALNGPVITIRKFLKELNKKQKLTLGSNGYTLYKDKALEMVQERLTTLNKKHYCFKFNNVAVKSLKTRWGSCSRRGNLNFNYQILFLTPRIRDYIMIHELCHLKEFNHSSRFWNWVSKAIPDHQELNRNLTENWVGFA